MSLWCGNGKEKVPVTYKAHFMQVHLFVLHIQPNEKCEYLIL